MNDLIVFFVVALNQKYFFLYIILNLCLSVLLSVTLTLIC